MGFLSLFLDVSNKNVLILGTGEVATRRANSFLDKQANVVLIGENINEELLNKGARLKNFKEIDSLVEWSDIVIIASGDKELSDYVASISKNKLLNRADDPFNGNLIVPNSFFIGDVEVSLYTNGKSPLMSKQLRKKIQKTITENDILEIELQNYCREILKSETSNQKIRKSILYNVSSNIEIKNLLKNKKIKEAKKQANRIIKTKIKDL